ncbi:MAG: hypothetical protein COA88_12845 [Kordia sp.]|nr:MAG: hypothetical protein COA88_12845 [Kordia sp.]
MIIQQWNIDKIGNAYGQPIPAGWQLIAHEVHIANNETKIVLCAYLDSSLEIVCKLEDFTDSDLKVPYADTAPLVFVQGVVEALLDAKYGNLEWSRVG